MGTGKRKKKPIGSPAVQPASKGKLAPILAAVFGIGVVATVVFLNLPDRKPESTNNASPPSPVPAANANVRETPAPATVPTGEAATTQAKGVSAATASETPSDAKPSFEVLKGRWLRPDGGYVVEIKSVDASGKMDASYSNPKPINVSKSEASRDGAAMKVFIELHDVNYPGSTYDLLYDPANDRLQGIYYQAALQQRFEVFFVRMK